MIRRAKTSDINTIVNLEKQGLKQTLGYDFIFQEISSNPFAIYEVLEINQTVIGYIGYHVVDDKAEILNIVINQQYQGQGYGKKLLSEAIYHMITSHVLTITLEVRDSHVIARSLYESLGFIATYKRKNYYKNEDAWVYIKEV